MIEYHIGGFKGTNSVLRYVTLNFPSGEMDLLNNKQLVINIQADVQVWFKSLNNLPIALAPACNSSGTLAVKYADNYKNMFRISTVQIQ